MKFKDYYAALEVARDAGPDEIKKAYRRLARKFHPDVSKEKDAEARFKEVNEAYDTLKDPEKRAAYDALGQHRPGEEFAAPPDWHGAFNAGGGGFEDIDLADLLDALGRQHGQRGQRSRAMRGRDYDVSAAISIEDALRGTRMHLQLQKPEGPQTLEVTIPPGVTAGQKLRLRGQGGKGRDAPDGDIYVHLELQPHPRYRASGKDLFFDLALAPWEAALGADVQVDTPEGPVVLTVKPGTHSAQKLRLRGRGLGPAGDRGDLYAVVHIDVPRTLSAQERDLFEQLARISTFRPRNDDQETQP